MKNIGKEVEVIDRNDAMWCGWWGIIKDYDGEYYHVAMANDSNMVAIFTRDQIRIKRSK